MQDDIKQAFQEGDAVRFQGKVWEVVGAASGGPLAGYIYRLLGSGHAEALAEEKDMERVPKGQL